MTNPTTWPRLNLAAGPVQVMDQTLRDAARPVLYHYDPAFIELFARTSGLLKRCFAPNTTWSSCRARPSSGSRRPPPVSSRRGQGAQSRLRRLRQVVRGFHSQVRRRDDRASCPYNDAIDPEDVRQALHANPGVKFLSVVHSETPSGTHNPVQEIGAVAHEFGVLTMVDTVSGLGAELLSPEEWGMDIAIAGPQKCLGGTPGLSLMTISPAAWEALEARKPEPLRASFLSILDWKSAWLEGKRFPYTPSVSEIYSLESVLDQTLAVGMERFVDRQQTIARACREGVKALGLELWPAREEIAAACVTAVRVPEGIDDAELRGTMRHRYGVMISPGYGELQGQLFRLGHMGPAQAHPTILAAQLAVLERSLADLGYPVQLGAGVGAAMAALEWMG